MTRVVPAQTELFAAPQPDLFAQPAERPALSDPLGELKELLDKVRSASELPWADAAAAMAEELRALWLARQAGDEGERLAAAIFAETERLFSAGE